jgi:hypothetical protein
VLAVYTGGSLDDLSRVTDNNNAYCGGGWGAKVSFDAVADTTYYIAVSDVGDLRENTFTLNLKPVEPPPNSTASAITDSGATYTSGTWTSEHVEVTLNAQDNEDGSGVKELTYSATGAQPIASTTVLAAELPKQLPIINIEGTTTISYFATDNAGNQESPAKTFTVKIDKSAPTLDTDNSDGTDGVTPDNRQTGVSRTVEPTATFSDYMDPTSLRTSAKLYRWNAPQKMWEQISARVSVVGKTATLDPHPANSTRLLAANKKFKVTFTTGAKNLAGLPMSRNRSWTFTTGTHSYSAVGDFSATQNPSGAWSYGSRPSRRSGFILYTTHYTDGAGLYLWTPEVREARGVAYNSTGETYSYLSIVHPPDVLNVHPGFAGQRSVIRWTAPTSDTVQIEGRFEGIDADVSVGGTTTDVAVVHNSAVTLFRGNINGYGATAPFTITRTVAAGDTIDFSVGWGSNRTYGNDSTGLSATISY